VGSRDQIRRLVRKSLEVTGSDEIGYEKEMEEAMTVPEVGGRANAFSRCNVWQRWTL
jgi:hypothetical protein